MQELRRSNKQTVRILFMGTPGFAATIFKGLVQVGWRFVGAVTQPDKARGRGRVPSQPPLKLCATAAGIEVFQPQTLKDPYTVDAIKGLSLDLILVAAYGKILPSQILELPRLGCFNIHASLLPELRGAAPINWAILRGYSVTGITIFKMDQGMDTGDIVFARQIAIDPEETAGELSQRLAELAIPIADHALECIVRGVATYTPQDHSRATYAPVLTKADGLIDWTLPAEHIRNRIRGLDPWPTAYTRWRGKMLKLFRAYVEDAEPDAACGEVVATPREGILVRAGKGIVVVREVQYEGGRRMCAADFLRGHPIRVGDRLG